MNKTQALNLKEQLFIKKLLENICPGFYRLRDLFGEHWNSIGNPTDFGSRVKHDVKAGHLPGLLLGPITSQNHQVYQIV